MCFEQGKQLSWQMHEGRERYFASQA